VTGVRCRTLLNLLSLLAVGCANDQAPREQPPRPQTEREAVALAQRAAYQRSIEYRCTSYGFIGGTADFRTCLMQVDKANRQQAAQTRKGRTLQ
jgi:hypothetical protein